MNNLNYVIVAVAELDKLTLSNYEQTSWDTLNKDHTATKTVLKYYGTQPSELTALTSFQGPYTLEQITPIVDSDTWRPIPAWMQQG